MNSKRIMALLATLLFCITFLPVTAISEAAEEAASSQADIQKQFATEMVQLVNNERIAAGLPPVSGDYEKLNEAAQLRAAELTTKFSHTRPNGRDCWSVFEEFGIQKSYGQAENVGGGHTTPQAAMKTWMKSKKGHHENILSPKVNYLGVGYAYDASSKYKHFWILLFVGVDQTLEIVAAETDGTYTQLACLSDPPVSAWTPAWESDNPGVVTIAPDGILTVHKPGIANITATITTCYTASVTTDVTVLESAFEDDPSTEPDAENTALPEEDAAENNIPT